MTIPSWMERRVGNGTRGNRRARCAAGKRQAVSDANGPAPCIVTSRVERLESRRLLSTVTWTSTAGGLWGLAANWTTAGSPSTHAVPQAGDDVVIDQPGNISITVSGGVSVNSITLTGDTLELQAGTMLTTAAAVTNGGTITVDATAQLAVGGSYSESAEATLSMPGGLAHAADLEPIRQYGFRSARRRQQRHDSPQ